MFSKTYNHGNFEKKSDHILKSKFFRDTNTANWTEFSLLPSFRKEETAVSLLSLDEGMLSVCF